MDTMHLKDPLVPFGFEDSALSLSLFLLPHALPLFFNNGKGPLYEKKKIMALNGLLCRCAFKPSFIHSCIHLKYLYVLVLWTKVASALEGLIFESRFGAVVMQLHPLRNTLDSFAMEAASIQSVKFIFNSIKYQIELFWY